MIATLQLGGYDVVQSALKGRTCEFDKRRLSKESKIIKTKVKAEAVFGLLF